MNFHNPHDLAFTVGLSPSELLPSTMLLMQKIIDGVIISPNPEYGSTTMDLTNELTPTDAESLWCLCRQFDRFRMRRLDPDRCTTEEVREAVLDAIYEMADCVQEKYLEQFKVKSQQVV
ncbi:MAG TPA: hypothetical protein VMU68_05665 [Acidimicrobiales bacterium]|nr:hypothetical protein [Acidimicrobiales bacterium]